MIIDTNSSLLNEIIEEELSHFLSVQNRGGTASCQERPDSFKIMRKMFNAVQTEEYLLSYHEDLKQAKIDNRNFMTEKYALMEKLIERVNFDEHIEKIVELETKLHNEVYTKYPHLFGPQNIDYFQNYLSCELQSLSAKTLKLYYENMIRLQDEGKNMVLERYQILMKLLNRPPLEEK